MELPHDRRPAWLEHFRAKPRTGRLLYFAYGSNMSRARLRARIPSATFITTAELTGHRLRFHKRGFDGSGKCDIELTGDPADKVFGVVFEIAAVEKPRLDRKEGLGFGYDLKTVDLRTAEGSTVSALAYFATRTDSALRPFAWYKTHVLTGARESGLPADYVRLIAAVETIQDPKPRRRRRELAIYPSAPT